ncbi:hypothetical protein EWM64_g9700 [Hericium alpestre]|uniref:Uncharacterized protein n=1 Tax=Hericium alpestre TaxID=135208 RepID=A0A4Y9ZK92_9AGAM|nr:hypothetical protein EWM64_g9700 [Hericium alpestre]
MTSIQALEPDVLTTAPLLIGGFIQSVSQGIIFAQAMRYWRSPLDDTRRMKIYVAVLVLLSAFQTSLIVYKQWLVLVMHEHWSSSPFNWTELFFNGLLCCVCETFLVRRCWKATKKNTWVLVFLVLIAAAIFVANLYLAIAIGQVSKHEVANNDPLENDQYFPTVFAFNFWIVGSMALDILVTSILMVYLWRSKTGLGYLDKALKHIISITWESAALPCVTMVIAVGLYHSKVARSRHLVLLFILLTGKFYVLGILRTLNSRGRLREKMKSTDFCRQSLGDWQWDQEPAVGATPRMEEVLLSPSTVLSNSSLYAHRNTESTIVASEDGSKSSGSNCKGKKLNKDPAKPPPPNPSNESKAETKAMQEAPQPQVAVAEPDRTELVTRGQSFLQTPHIVHQDVASKRRFLLEKGLSEGEVNQLIQELPPQLPLIPPRTYPQPPPSNLPGLLAGIFRVFTWLTGGSLVCLAIYYRFIYPRLMKSASARHSIKSHQKDLLEKLNVSLNDLKSAQTDAFSELPAPSPILSASGDKQSHIPEMSLLRCALSDFAKQEQRPTTEELFQALFAKIPWIESDTVYQEKLWAALSSNPSFSQSTEGNTQRWSNVPPPTPPPSTLILALDKLKSTFPPPPSEPSAGRFQHTLQSLIDFTGYLTTQTYALSSSYRFAGVGSSTLGPEEENVRREIRALKGLVLNRRTFMSPRPSNVSSPVSP